MYDRPTPGYFSHVGFLPQNPMLYSCFTIAEPVSQLTYTDVNGRRTRSCSGTITQFMYNPLGGVYNGQGFSRLTVPLPSAFNLDALIAEAKAKALDKYSRSEYSFREPIAEVARTIRTIKHPIHAIKRVVSRFSKKRDKIVKKGDAKALADLWLSYSVNVSPNLKTVDDAVDAFARRMYSRFEVNTSYAVSKYDSGPLYVSSTQSPSLSGMRHAQRVVRASAKAVILYTVVDAAQASTILGLRARHLPGLAWELVPLSFVVDRLINVKRFIDVASVMMSSKVRIAGACTVVRVDDVYTRWLTNLSVSGSPPPSPNSTPKLVERSFTYERSAWSPSVLDVLPGVTPRRLLGNLHSLLDVVSLTIGRLR